MIKPVFSIRLAFNTNPIYFIEPVLPKLGGCLKTLEEPTLETLVVLAEKIDSIQERILSLAAGSMKSLSEDEDNLYKITDENREIQKYVNQLFIVLDNSNEYFERFYIEFAVISK